MCSNCENLKTLFTFCNVHDYKNNETGELIAHPTKYPENGC